MTAFDIASYLDRIGRAGVPQTYDGLRDLQLAQLRAIPFENIDVLLGRTPDMALSAIVDKAVRRGRGGYCFELNGLFEAALTALGFAVRRSLARVRLGKQEPGLRGHLALLVEIDGRRYLADAGFGGPGSLAPLAVDTPGEQRAPNGVFRMTGDPVSGETVVERLTDDGWFQLYGFDDAWVTDRDIVAANHFAATSPESLFGSRLMLGGYVGDTRIGIFDQMMTVETAAGTERRAFADRADFADTLTRQLRLALDAEMLDRVWHRIGGAAQPTAGSAA